MGMNEGDPLPVDVSRLEPETFVGEVVMRTEMTAFLQAAHKILRPGGRVAVLDLLAHQCEQARELYADVWLGFTEAELTGFLEDAGFGSVSAEVVSKDEQNPVFQTLLAFGSKLQRR
jgi:ArsR family transcriptional regulator